LIINKLQNINRLGIDGPYGVQSTSGNSTLRPGT